MTFLSKWWKSFPIVPPATPLPTPLPIPVPTIGPVAADGRWRIAEPGLTLIQDFEKCRLESYRDAVGVWTIGWGTTYINGYPVEPGMVISQKLADELLIEACQEIADAIQPLVRQPQTQNQIDALISFTYNVGVSNFKQSSILRYINGGKPLFEDLFVRWNKATDRQTGQLIELAGLTRRRKAEFRLYMS